MTHALVIGGTGMLRAVSLWLSGRFDAVSVVARSQAGLDALGRGAPGTIHPLCVDYRDSPAFAQALRRAVETRGPIETAVSWIHSGAPAAPGEVAAVLEPGARYFDLTGTGDPSSLSRAEERAAVVLARPGVIYCRVILGRVRKGAGWRWLTDEEISVGVIRAVETDAASHRIGE